MVIRPSHISNLDWCQNLVKEEQTTKNVSGLCLGSCLIYPKASNNTEKLERKLVSVGEVEGLVVGAFTEVSAATHTLIVHLAKSSVQVARPQLGSRGQLRSEEAEIALTTAFLRRTFSICAVKGLAFSLGRQEGLGAGAAAAQGRRSQAAHQEHLWRRQRQAHALCVRQGRDILRRGQFHLS